MVKHFGTGSAVAIYKNVVLTTIKTPVDDKNTKLTDM